MTIKTFIRRYEDAADTDGASERDLAKQIVPFIIGADLKEEVEEMSGYEDRNWEVLKRQLLNRFGSSLALVKYTRQDLKDLIKAQSDNGGIKTLEDFKMFRSKYENITHYLRRMGYVTNLEDFRENLLETLSPELEVTVTRELIRDNKMLVSKNGGDILPDTATLFTYIHREVQTASVMERRKNIKKGINPAKPAQPAPTKPPANPEKAIEEITKTLANWNVQKKPTTFYQSTPPKGLYWLQPPAARSVAATAVTLVYQTNVTSAAPTDTLCLCSNVSVGPADIKSVWATDVTSVASGRRYCGGL
ncbi:hypothetical protein PCASD_18103 [Puccinia coronata f. sp. avenae]|uniref:Uncharacterized protein n=1 Tax=Puccinia coronata f. sp. avenae TaxID=200324 RepID=A0A2N5SSL5_9BASI|nr:hypothetical protein PCASD_18103 [Puccinia coronata f. sp. avenae]